MQKLLTFFGKNISIYTIFNESFNDTLTNDIVSFEQLGPGLQIAGCMKNSADFVQTALYTKSLILVYSCSGMSTQIYSACRENQRPQIYVIIDAINCVCFFFLFFSTLLGL